MALHRAQPRPVGEPPVWLRGQPRARRDRTCRPWSRCRRCARAGRPALAGAAARDRRAIPRAHARARSRPRALVNSLARDGPLNGLVYTMLERLLTPSDVADLCQISSKTVLRAIHRGRLRASRLGEQGAYRMREADVEAWIAETPAATASAGPRGTAAGARASRARRPAGGSSSLPTWACADRRGEFHPPAPLCRWTRKAPRATRERPRGRHRSVNSHASPP